MKTCIKKFAEIGMQDIDAVGYKNASIAKMMSIMQPKGVNVPKGFAITADAYHYFIDYNQLELPLQFLMAAVDRKGFSNLAELGSQARKIIMAGRMPADLGMAIIDAYDYLFDLTETAVAVRSSAITSKLVNAAASGVNDSFLNVKGHCALLYAIRQCFASLYTDRAIKHAIENGYDLCTSAMCIGVQEMVRADKGCSGIGFTHDPNSGSADLIYLKGIWGLGKILDQEVVEPDEYVILKLSVKTGSILLADKELGSKQKMMVYADEEDEASETALLDTPQALQDTYVLNDKDVLQLSTWALYLDNNYQKPMCFEWAKDGVNHQLYLIQVSPFVPDYKDDKTTVIKTASKKRVLL